MKHTLRLWWTSLVVWCASTMGAAQSPHTASFFSYGGVCLRPDGRHLDHAAVACLECGMTTRLRAGRFSFPRLPANTTWTIAFARPVADLRDITVADQRLLEAALAGRDTLNFWQRLAADLDRNGSLDSLDLFLLRRLVRTGRPDSLVRWHFVPDTAARRPGRGWPELVADTFRIEAAAGRVLNQKIMAIKMGDLAWPQPPEERPPFDPAFSLGRIQACTPDEEVRIPLKTSDALSVAAFQFGLMWDEDLLEWQGFEPAAGCLAGAVSFAERQQGLAVVWSRPFDCAAADTLPAVVGWLRFRLRGAEPGCRARVWFSDEHLPVEVLDAQGRQLNGIFTAGRVEVTAPGSRVRVHVLEQRGPTCAGAADGRIRLAASGSAVRSWQWNTGAVGPELAHLPADSYTVTITDSAGCPFAFGPIVLAEPPPLVLDAEVGPPSCAEVASGRIRLRPQGGVPPWHVRWHDGPTDLWERIGLPAGRYALTLTDSLGCSLERTFVLEPPVQWRLVAAVHLPKGESQHAAFRLYHLAKAAQMRFAWSDGWTKPAREDLPFGKRSLELRDAQGCARRLGIEWERRHDGQWVPRLLLERTGPRDRVLTDAVLVLAMPVQARLTIVDKEGRVLHAAGLSLPAGTTVLCMSWPEAWKAVLDLPSGLRYEWRFE